MTTRGNGVRHAANWLNLSTPVGLVVAAVGRASLRRLADGIILAEGYGFGFPAAGAFTIGDVVLTSSTMAALERRTPGVLGHEKRHARQYAVAGVWFLPAYLLGSAWSLLRTGHPALRNPLERSAGLVSGGYVDAGTGAPLHAGPARGVRMPRFRRWSGRRGGAPSAAPAASRAGDAAG